MATGMVAVAIVVSCGGADEAGEAGDDSDATVEGPARRNPVEASAEAAPSDAGADVREAEASCDVDRDGHNAMDACGGDDCDDEDPRAVPDAAFRDDLITQRTKGDWNCSKTVERLYPANLVCGALPPIACTGQQGFTDNPACGAAGTFVVCQQVELTCLTVSSQLRLQGCK